MAAPGGCREDGPIPRIDRVLTDNDRNYRRCTVFEQAVAELGARQKFTRPHCPWTNGKVERFNRTLAREWAYRRPYTSNQQPATNPGLQRLARLLQQPTPPHRLHRPTPHKPPVTNVTAEYS